MDDLFDQSQPIFQRFDLIRMIGRGGMGTVFEAFDRLRNARVALKLLSNYDPTTLYMFKQEFRSLANIVHPNLVGLHELLSEKETWFFTMDLIEGRGFLDYVRGESLRPLETTVYSSSVGELDSTFTPHASADPGTLQPERLGPALGDLPAAAELRLRRSLGGLAAGVCALHAAGKVHRDLKPSNVMVRQDERVVILDFGLVMDVTPGGDDPALREHVTGTIPYMSPEQASGMPLSAASDWYSVGVMLYEALTGCYPFGGSIAQILDAKKRKVPPPPSQVARVVPPDLDALCRRLLATSPADRPGDDEVRALLGVQVEATTELTSTAALGGEESRLVGRDEQHSRLSTAYDACLSGTPILVRVQGPSGMGKSALVRSFLAELQQEGTVVLSGRCYERESVPYKALDPLVDRLTRYLLTLPQDRVEALMPRHVRALAQVFPVLDRVPGVRDAVRRSETTLDARELRRRAFGALRELLARLAEHVPLVLAIDDLQWGDVDSSLLLQELMRPPDPPPVLLLASFRSDTAEDNPVLVPLLEYGGRPGEVAYDIPVGPLPPAEAEKLALTHLAATVAHRTRLAAHIARESGGVPFFVEELARFAALSATEGTAFERGDLVSLDEYTRIRVGRLPPEARALVEVVAVAGHPLPLEAAAHASGQEAIPWDSVRLLQAAHMVATRGLHGGQQVECYHDRIREAVASSVEAGARRDMHRMLAGTLEQVQDTEPELLALHYRECGETVRAATFARKAADQSANSLAFDRASALYRSALAMGAWAPAEEAAIRRSLAETLANAGRGVEAAEEFLRLATAAAPDAGWRLQLQAAEQLLRVGHVDRGQEILGQVLKRFGMRIPASTPAALAAYFWFRARLKLRSQQFVQRSEDQVPVYLLDRIDACWAVSLGFGMVDPVRASGFQFRCLLYSLQAGEPYRIARSLASEGAYSAAFGGRGFGRSDDLLERAERLAREANSTHALAIVRVCGAIAAFQQGKWTTTLQRAQEAEQICLEKLTNVAWELRTARIYQLAALGWMGRFGEYRHRTREMVTDALGRNDLHTVNHMRAGSMLHLGLMQDDPEGAVKDIAECVGDLSQATFTLLHFYALRSRVCIELYLSNGAEAVRLADELSHKTGRSTAGRIALTRIYVLEMQANSRLCAAGASPGADRAGAVVPVEKAVQVALRCADKADQVGLAWTSALAELWRGGAARLLGHLDEAARHHREALDRFERLDMKLYAAAARCRLGEVLGGDEGRKLADAARTALESEAIARPDRVISMVAPEIGRKS
jgi:serine/threonine protein kinase